MKSLKKDFISIDKIMDSRYTKYNNLIASPETRIHILQKVIVFVSSVLFVICEFFYSDGEITYCLLLFFGGFLK